MRGFNINPPSLVVSEKVSRFIACDFGRTVRSMLPKAKCYVCSPCTWLIPAIYMYVHEGDESSSHY